MGMAEGFDPYYTWLGIPPHEQPANNYRLLGITLCESNPEVISNAADRVMLQLRAFQSGQRSRESQQLLNEVAMARVVLLDPAKKAAYDAALLANANAAVPPAAPPSDALPVALPVNVPEETAIPIVLHAPPRASTAAGAARRQPAARRRKPMPRFIVIALVAAALVAIGGGMAFVWSFISSARPFGIGPTSDMVNGPI